MAYRWPAGTACKRMTLDVEDCWCPVCDRHMHVCDHRYHHLWTLEGPTTGGQPSGTLSRRLMHESRAYLQPRSRIVPQHAALVYRLGGVVLAGPSPLCPSLVSAAAAFGVKGDPPDQGI